MRVVKRASSAAALVAFAAAGFAVADGFVAEQVRPVRRLAPARPRADAVRRAEAGPSVVDGGVVGAGASTGASKDEAPAWRERDDAASSVAGTGGAEVRATAAWRVVYDSPASTPISADAAERAARWCAKRFDAVLAAEAPLGAAAWESSAFQACGSTAGRLVSAGRQFWPCASPEASAAWYADALGVRADAATTARVVDRLARFESRRAGMIRSVLDRLVDAVRDRGDAGRRAYFAESGRVFLFDADRFLCVDEIVNSSLAAETAAAARAAEICR